MYAKAAFFLFAFFLLLLPILNADHSTTQSATPTAIITTEATGTSATPTAEITAVNTPEPTIEATNEPTAEITPAPTLEATPEITLEATVEATLELTLEPTAVVLVGDSARGDLIFHEGFAPAPACINCHNPTVTGKNGFALGPGLKGINMIAATRVEGLTAEEYIEQSIRHPGAYIVGGFRDIMYPNFGTDYSDQNIADLVAYLMTL